MWDAINLVYSESGFWIAKRETCFFYLLFGILITEIFSKCCLLIIKVFVCDVVSCIIVFCARDFYSVVLAVVEYRFLSVSERTSKMTRKMSKTFVTAELFRLGCLMWLWMSVRSFIQIMFSCGLHLIWHRWLRVSSGQLCVALGSYKIMGLICCWCISWSSLHGFCVAQRFLGNLHYITNVRNLNYVKYIR